MIWGSKCHQNNSPVVCDGNVKYEEVEVDRLLAILKTGGEGCLMTQKINKLSTRYSRQYHYYVELFIP